MNVETFSLQDSLHHLAVNSKAIEFEEIFYERNLETAVAHGFLDLPVSPLYYYYKEGEDWYCDPECKIPIPVDPEERGGVIREGLYAQLENAVNNPGQLVFLYSPPGKIVFDDNPNNKYAKIDEEGGYKKGQLYVCWWDGQKINYLAMSTDENTEILLEEILKRVYETLPRTEDEVSRITHFLTNPVVSEFDIDEFIQHLKEEYKGNLLYRSVYYDVEANEIQRNFDGRSLADEIVKALSGEVDPIVEQAVREAKRIFNMAISSFGGLTSEGILKVYLTAYSIAAYGLPLEKISFLAPDQVTLRLGGSCGGAEVNLRLNDLLGFNFYGFGFAIPSQLSLSETLVLQSDGLPIVDKYGTRIIQCPSCNEYSVRPYNKLIPKCPKCGSEDIACKRENDHHS